MAGKAARMQIFVFYQLPLATPYPEMPIACGTSSRRKSFNSASALERFCTWRNTVASSITVVSILAGIGGTGATLFPCSEGFWVVCVASQNMIGEVIGHAGNYDMNFSWIDLNSWIFHRWKIHFEISTVTVGRSGHFWGPAVGSSQSCWALQSHRSVPAMARPWSQTYWWFIPVGSTPVISGLTLAHL